eukprot:symbB.v1.2.034226.t1/scaffold4385.1/size40373/1
MSEDGDLRIQVAGFHGDAITVTLPARASGLELRRRVQEQLPPKSGARLSLLLPGRHAPLSM